MPGQRFNPLDPHAPAMTLEQIQGAIKAAGPDGPRTAKLLGTAFIGPPVVNNFPTISYLDAPIWPELGTAVGGPGFPSGVVNGVVLREDGDAMRLYASVGE